jgi:hypothetical protein
MDLSHRVKVVAPTNKSDNGGPNNKKRREGRKGNVDGNAGPEGGEAVSNVYIVGEVPEAERYVPAKWYEDETVPIPGTDSDGKYPDSGSNGSDGTISPEEERALALELSTGYGPPGIEYDTSPESVRGARVMGAESKAEDPTPEWKNGACVLGASLKRKL